MARIRRGGHIFITWKGDHPPLHVHVHKDDGKFITRVNLETMEPMDAEHVSRKIVELINELREEGRI